MIPPNIKDLITAIIEKTESKKAIWGKTSRTNEFKLIFENGAVTTDNWAHDEIDLIDFVIYNNFGDKIDSYNFNKSDIDYHTIKRLHSAARKNFYKVEETITNLFEEINSNKNIGIRKVEEDDYDPSF